MAHVVLNQYTDLPCDPNHLTQAVRTEGTTGSLSEETGEDEFANDSMK